MKLGGAIFDPVLGIYYYSPIRDTFVATPRDQDMGVEGHAQNIFFMFGETFVRLKRPWGASLVLTKRIDRFVFCFAIMG